MLFYYTMTAVGFGAARSA